MANPATKEKFRIELDAEFGPGSVKNLWKSFDSVGPESNAEWVDMPRHIVSLTHGKFSMDFEQ